MNRTTRKLLRKALARLPGEVELYYVEHDDALRDEQVAKLLGGREPDVQMQVTQHFQVHSDPQCYHELLRQALSDAESRQRVKDDDAAFEQFREACDNRDRSNPFRELLRHTGRKMVRAYIRDEHKQRIETPYDTWNLDEEQVRAEAVKVAKAAGIDYDLNEKDLIELVENASGGGELCVEAYLDIASLYKGIDHLLRNPKEHRVRLTFTDPYLLLHDGLNGSGHDAKVKGTVQIEFGYDDLDPTAGVLVLDEKGAGTGYSWSDDIAWVHKPAYESNPKMELL
jgi:hypothetical protein